MQILQLGTLRDRFPFSQKNHRDASLVHPGGLHAVFIRSALSAVRVYEQAVTGLGGPNCIHWCLESQRGEYKRAAKWEESVRELSIIHWTFTSTEADPSPPPGKTVRAEVVVSCHSDMPSIAVQLQWHRCVVLWFRMCANIQIVCQCVHTCGSSSGPYLFTTWPSRLIKNWREREKERESECALNMNNLLFSFHIQKKNN